MSPVRPRGPAARRLLLLLGSLPLLLLPRAPGVRGDCGPLPVVPLAQPVSGGSVSFPVNTTVLYKCDQGFVKIPGMPDAVVCLSSNKWTDIKEFCNRSCGAPPRLLYGILKKIYISKNYFPEGTVLEYECRPGFRRIYPLVGKTTCLSNLTWSTPDVFCEKKSCPTPREIENGQVSVATDILLGSQIFFSCDPGYRLQGAASAFCMIVENGVDWSNAFGVCTKILCPQPPQIKNGQIIDERDTYEYRQVATYECDRGFTIIGENQITCTVTDGTGEWSGPPPECKGKSPPPFIPPIVQKPTTTTVPDTEVSLPPQKASTVLPATSRPPISRMSTHPPTTASEEKGLSSSSKSLIYGFVAGTIIIGSLFLAKVFWDRGKSGHYMTQENNKAPIVNYSNEADATSEIRPLSNKVQKVYGLSKTSVSFEIAIKTAGLGSLQTLRG